MSFARPAALVALVAVAAVAGTPAQAQDSPSRLAGFNAWTTYTMSEDGHLVCYAVTPPSRAEDRGKRGKTYLMVTHRPAEHAFDVVSIALGQDLPADGSARVTIDRQSFDFFTRSQAAWTRDAESDKLVVNAMAAGRELAIKAKGTRGIEATDRYSLAGFSKALASIDRACQVKR